MKVVHYVERGIPTEGDLERAKKVRAQQNDYYFRDAALFDPRVMERCDAVYVTSEKRGDEILSAYADAGVPKHDLRVTSVEERDEQEPSPGDAQKQTDELPLGPAESTPKGAVRPRGKKVADKDTGDKESS